MDSIQKSLLGRGFILSMSENRFLRIIAAQNLSGDAKQVMKYIDIHHV
jgi:hypothetical protein